MPSIYALDFGPHHSRSSLLWPTVKRSLLTRALRSIHRSVSPSPSSARRRDKNPPFTPAARRFGSNRSRACGEKKVGQARAGSEQM